MKIIRQDFCYLIKTIIDYSAALICLVLMLPVIVILSIVILIEGKGPVFYTQKRVGKSGKQFTLYKFRSMHFGTEGGVPLLTGKNDKRITATGRFMRKHKFDEIPNFINVLRGEMSLVGPRPEQQFFIDQISSRAPEYLKLLEIKPGITSWGQVKYGYASDADQMIERLKFDLCYLENRSLWFDLKIFVYTAGIILKGQGV
jgi:lipopolysaccharide/colanic/teichoic acid biosynthesis glycosyltransferase